MRKYFLLFALAVISFSAQAQNFDDTCDPIDSLLVIDTMGNLTVYWNRNDTALAYNYRFRILGETEWTTNATLDSFIVIDETGECVQYEVSISTVCAFDTSTFTLDTVISFCPMANRNILADPGLLSVFPVPFASNITITSNDPLLTISNIIIRDISGRSMTQTKGQRWQETSINTDAWSNGVYLIEIETSRGWHFQKVLKL